MAFVGLPRWLEIEALADAFRSRLPMTGPPVSVETLAGLAGIADITVSDRISGSALLVSGLAGSYGIVLNRHDSKIRRRFSIAHEIGHLVVHPDRRAHEFMEQLAARHQRSPIEGACDHFAACLLMPRTWVNVSVHGRTVIELARLFIVSAPAMRARLGECGFNDLARS